MGKVADDASIEAARDRITEAGIKIFQGPEKRVFRNYTLFPKTIYDNQKPPLLVFVKLDGLTPEDEDIQMAMARMLRDPGSERAFQLNNVIAVFFEGKTILVDGKHVNVVLATFVYGEVEREGLHPTRVYVLQRAASSANTRDNRFQGQEDPSLPMRNNSSYRMVHRICLTRFATVYLTWQFNDR